ncbi:MAG: TIGR03936 family radical SAM-associated protein [Bacillota bacterium]
MRIRAEFTKGDGARYVSHLDLIRTWERAMRRAGLPVAMSQGFNPHPKMAPASSLPVGQTSRSEVIEVTLTEPVDAAEFARRVNAAMPEGLRVTRAKEVSDEAASPASVVSGATYEARPGEGSAADGGADTGSVAEAVRRFLAAGEVVVTRKSDKGERRVDLRPLVHGLRFEGGVLWMTLAAGREGTARPTDLLTALGLDPADWTVERTGLYRADGSDSAKWTAAWDL